MKTKYIIPIFTGLWIVFGCITLLSCSSDDDLNSVEMLVGLKYKGMNTRNLAYTPTPAGIIEDYNEIEMTVQASRELLADATVTIEVDESYVEAYNKENETNYKLIPASMYTEVNGKQVILKKGEVTAAYKIKLNDPLKLMEVNDAQGLIIPVKIVSVSSQDKGLRVSSNQNIAYFIVNFNAYRFVKEVSEEAKGELFDKTDWTASADDSWLNYTASKAIDNNLKTSWVSLYLRSELTIDMNRSNPINGIYINSSYIYRGYWAFFTSQIELAVSDDNTNWTNMGTADLIVDYKNGVNCYLYFYTPVTCRYVRIIPTDAFDHYTSITEINFIK